MATDANEAETSADMAIDGDKPPVDEKIEPPLKEATDLPANDGKLETKPEAKPYVLAKRVDIFGVLSAHSSQSLSPYRDRRFPGTQDEFEQALQTSTIVYVGNLSFYTTEEQIYDLFSRCGEIKKIIMGLDKNSKTPCGFCFVMYYTREDTEDAVKYISGTMLDERPIRVDFDWGFQEGRQWGRGKSGGQVRDEYRTDYDPGRGGYGKLVQRELESHRQLVDYTGNLGSYYNTGGSHGHGSSHRESGYKRRRGDDDYRSSDRYRRDRESRAEKNPRFRERRDSDDEDSSRH